ncbi:MAG: hypothetical protein KBT06_00655 [Prevotellaceae bacterium]|nr:hypothetical protein [Candidatus Colivivens equi]
MRYWNNYIDTVSKSPNDTYRAMTNASVAAQWDNTTLLQNIEEEHSVGTFTFHNIEAWVQTVTTFTNNIIKDANDFRELLFKVNPHNNSRGQYYIWDDNYWIVYDTTNNFSTHAVSLMRRCNNTIKWLDVDTGIIHEYPCVLEYDISATNPRVDKDINVANSSVTLVIQGNENTRKLKRNQRFVINGIPYRFVAYNNYMQSPTLNADVTLYFIDLDFDIEKPTDDIDNNIADIKEYQYELNIAQIPTQQVKGFTAIASANVRLNGEPTDKTVTWTGNKNVKINDSGEYTIVGNMGDVAQITAHFGSFSKTININIVDAVEEQKTIVVTPTFAELNKYEKINFSVYLYVDGIKQDDVPVCVVDGVDSQNYQLTQQGNDFTLTNLHQSKSLMNITFTMRDVSETLCVKLKALY